MNRLEQELRSRLRAATRKAPDRRRAQVLQVLVDTLSIAFNLRPDELAILVFSQDREMLRFVYPPELAEKGSNTFPLAVPSLAGRVALTGETLLYNDMREVPHLAFYERVRVKGVEPVQIQKLLAVAAKDRAGRPQAVIEVSRRGQTLGAAGPDFRSKDQQLLERLAGAAGAAMARAFAE